MYAIESEIRKAYWNDRSSGQKDYTAGGEGL